MALVFRRSPMSPSRVALSAHSGTKVLGYSSMTVSAASPFDTAKVLRSPLPTSVLFLRLNPAFEAPQSEGTHTHTHTGSLDKEPSRTLF